MICVKYIITGKVTRSTTQLRIGPDNDGEREKVFKIQLLSRSQAQSILPNDEDISIVIRLGSAIIPEKRDPLYVMISDDNRAIGFKISESGPIYGAEGEPGKYLDPVSLRGESIRSPSCRKEYHHLVGKLRHPSSI